MIRSVAPTTEAELVDIVNTAIREQTPLFAHGGRTKQHVGPWPSDAATSHGLAVSMQGFNGIVAYEPNDMVVTVSAGMRVDALQAVLREHNQWLPLDPGFSEATVGGVLATATTGPRRQLYGTLRDQILGLRVIGPRGAITKSGGRVVKNVAGFDLHRLHIGAFGSLGILVDASFKVSTIAHASAAWLVPFSDLKKAQGFLLDVGQSPLRPACLDLVSGQVARRLMAASPAFLAHLDAPCVAVVGVEGSAPFVQRHKHDLQKLTPSDHVGQWFDNASALWSAFTAVLAAHKEKIVIRVGGRPHDVMPWLDVVSGYEGLHLHSGLGIARVVFDATASLPSIVTAIHRLAEKSAAQGGYAVVESAPLELVERGTLPFLHAPQSTPSTNQLFSHLRHTWDPKHLFHPGRAPV